MKNLFDIIMGKKCKFKITVVSFHFKFACEQPATNLHLRTRLASFSAYRVHQSEK